jgi:hypothetical protein
MNTLLVLLALVMLFVLAKKYKVLPFGMMALTADNPITERPGEGFYKVVEAAAVIYEGALLVYTATGEVKPAVTEVGAIAAGVATENVDNTVDGHYVNFKKGIFLFANSAAADEITAAEIGDSCYIVDDCTVAKTNGGATRSICGEIIDVTTDGVFVRVGFAVPVTAGLLAAQNLNDVANKATSRANLLANKVVLCLRATDLLAANTVLYGIVTPVAGTIVKIRTVLKGHALAAGDATLTGKIGGVAITDGAVTITQAGSAIGDKDLATPSALNVVAAGDEIQLLIGGANTDAAAFAEVSIYIET